MVNYCFSVCFFTLVPISNIIHHLFVYWYFVYLTFSFHFFYFLRLFRWRLLWDDFLNLFLLFYLFRFLNLLLLYLDALLFQFFFKCSYLFWIRLFLHNLSVDSFPMLVIDAELDCISPFYHFIEIAKANVNCFCFTVYLVVNAL